jgi:hypothetical protein
MLDAILVNPLINLTGLKACHHAGDQDPYPKIIF